MTVVTRRDFFALGALLGLASDQLFGTERSRMKMIADARFDPVGEATSAAVNSGDIPGALSMIWKDGEVCYTRIEGLRDGESRAPLEQTTLFGIASMSKPITVAVALMLVEEGLLKLSDPITQWAPEFAKMRVLRRPDGPLDDTYPAARSIS